MPLFFLVIVGVVYVLTAIFLIIPPYLFEDSKNDFHSTKRCVLDSFIKYNVGTEPTNCTMSHSHTLMFSSHLLYFSGVGASNCNMVAELSNIKSGAKH